MSYDGQGAAIEVKLTEHGSTTLPLVADHATHGVYLEKIEGLVCQKKQRIGGRSNARTSAEEW